MNPDRKRLIELQKELSEHAHRYYVLDQPIISDAEYDKLFQELLALESAHPDLISLESPTQRIGGAVRSGFKTILHTHPMLSLNNVFSDKEFIEFDNRCKKQLGLSPDTSIDYAVEPKIDGLGIELVYANDVLIQASTRGDGTSGEDVSANARTIGSIPLRLRQPLGQRLEVRGEVFMPKLAFAKLNSARQKNDEAPFANPRNAAAGSLRQLDPGVTAQRPLMAIMYALSNTPLGNNLPSTHLEFVKWLKTLGFATLPSRLCHGSQEVLLAYQDFLTQRTSFPYEMDGVVIKVNSHQLQNDLGQVARAPRWAVAYKMPSQQATTLVQSITVQVGRTGALTPVAELKPVNIGGALVSRATLHNAGEIERQDVRVGDTVLLTRAGDVIPDIVQVILEKRPVGTVPFEFPLKCPACATTVINIADEAVIRCPNKKCPAQLREKILHFASRKAMDIEGLGERLVAELVDKKFVLQLPDLYRLNAADLLSLERLGDKSTKKLLEKLQQARNPLLARFIYALGIRHVGEHMAHILAQTFGGLEKLQAASSDDLLQIPGIGPEVAQSVVAFFSDPEEQATLKVFRELGVYPQRVTISSETGKLIGQTIVVTGTLESLSRSDAFDLIRQHGGQPTSAVTRKTDLVVAGSSPGSKLTRAKELGLRVITELDFLKLIRE